MKSKTSMKTILYIQHTGALGGSAMSLLYTVEHLDKHKYHPIIALTEPNEKIKKLYNTKDVKTIDWPGISAFYHTTAAWGSIKAPLSTIHIFIQILMWRKSERRTLELIKHINPDIVHLNSATLCPSARALLNSKRPFFWHVRESPARGYFGLRLNLMRRLFLQNGKRMIFLSKADQEAWTNSNTGQILPNFVNSDRFAKYLKGKTEARKLLGLRDCQKVILYCGGLSWIKGIFILIPALAKIREKYPDIICLMPGIEAGITESFWRKPIEFLLPIFGHGTTRQRAREAINRHNLNNSIREAGFVESIEDWIAASDLLVFPATHPHFARPVIEASTAGIPVVATKTRGISETLIDGHTGLITKKNDSKALANAIAKILSNPEFSKQLGQNGRIFARENFCAEKIIARLLELYRKEAKNDSNKNRSV